MQEPTFETLHPHYVPGFWNKPEKVQRNPGFLQMVFDKLFPVGEKSPRVVKQPVARVGLTKREAKVLQQMANGRVMFSFNGGMRCVGGFSRAKVRNKVFDLLAFAELIEHNIEDDVWTINAKGLKALAEYKHS